MRLRKGEGGLREEVSRETSMLRRKSRNMWIKGIERESERERERMFRIVLKVKI